MVTFWAREVPIVSNHSFPFETARLLLALGSTVGTRWARRSRERAAAKEVVVAHDGRSLAPFQEQRRDLWRSRSRRSPHSQAYG